jgi:CBS domain-containing protein
MRVKEIMTRNPACCTPDTRLQEVARMMVDHDCGEIPVVRSNSAAGVVGVVTDRDIVTRAVAGGKNPLELTAQTCMSTPPITVSEDASMDECLEVMELNQIRRVPVVDADGAVRGMVSQADIARAASTRETGDLVRQVSQPA